MMFAKIKEILNDFGRTKEPCPICKNGHSTVFVSEIPVPPPSHAHKIVDPVRHHYELFSSNAVYQCIEETWRCPTCGPFTLQDSRIIRHAG